MRKESVLFVIAPQMHQHINAKAQTCQGSVLQGLQGWGLIPTQGRQHVMRPSLKEREEQKRNQVSFSFFPKPAAAASVGFRE